MKLTEPRRFPTTQVYSPESICCRSDSRRVQEDLRPLSREYSSWWSFIQVIWGRGFPVALHRRRSELLTGRIIFCRFIFSGLVNLGGAGEKNVAYIITMVTMVKWKKNCLHILDHNINYRLIKEQNCDFS